MFVASAWFVTGNELEMMDGESLSLRSLVIKVYTQHGLNRSLWSELYTL